MELPVELFLALRYLRPRRSFVSVITVLSFMGVTLGVMVLIVVLSVMAGFRQRLDDKIIGFNAHITVAMANGEVMYDYDKAIELIKKDPEVLAASPIIRGPVLVQFHNRMTPAFIKSVPMEGDDPVLPLSQYVKMGEYELRGDSVIVGTEWSKRNGAFPGDKIDIFGPTFINAIAAQKSGVKTDIPLPEEPIIRGIFQTGQFDYDLNFLLVSTELAQRIWGMPNAVHGIAVRVKNPDQAAAVRDRLNNSILPKTLEARTWMDDNRDLFNAIATERVVMTFILFFVMVVAAFGLCSTLITITVQKSREIGLMKALGASDFQVSGVFLFHGIVVGVVGAVGGTIAGLGVLYFRNPFRDFLLHTYHIQVFSPSVYGQTDIPAVINPVDVTLIALSAVVICILAALIPAVSAARLAPARALRYE
jgi:lipoprotein-releasing system permease protein